MDTRAARLARASVTASVSTLVTAVSHAAAGGAAPHPALLLVAFALALLFCLALTGRTLSAPRLVIAVGASQALLHGVFAMAGPPPAALLHAGPAHAAGMPGMDHPTGPGMAGGGGLADLAGRHGAGASLEAAAHAGTIDGAMILAHVFAGLLTVLALAASERAFWGLFDSLRLAGSALLRFVAVVEPAPALPARRAALVLAAAILRPRPTERRMLALTHRGPPALAA